MPSVPIERPLDAASGVPTSEASAQAVPKIRQDQKPADTKMALIPVILLLGITLAGSPYYLLSLGGRVRSPWHPWLRPSGYVGQTAGVLALALFLFLWLYPLRKRLHKIEWLGQIGKWLDVHIAAGLTLPLLAAIHASWRFTGLIGLGYAALLVVAASGIAGRYLYVRIPRQRSGAELSILEAAAERRALVTQLAVATGLTPEEVETTLAPSALLPGRAGILRTISQMVRDDLSRRSAARALARRWRAEGRGGTKTDRSAIGRIVHLARREMALAQHVRMLTGIQHVFRLWHAAHKPVAITALVAVLIHVVVVVSVGATWFR